MLHGSRPFDGKIAPSSFTVACEVNPGYPYLEQRKWRHESGSVPPEMFELHFFFAGFFFAGLAVAGFSLPPIKLSESAALNGNCFTDVCPVVLSVTSTRRLLASMIVLIWARILCRSPGVMSGFCSTESFTCSAVSCCSLPSA